MATVDDENNIPQTASGSQHVRRLLSSDHQLSPWADPELALKPATKDDFRRELTACLALCGGIGLTEDGRREWLRAAWGTLQDMPADLLERGCAEARKTADHPSKIVPTIIRETEEALHRRRAVTARPTPQIAGPKPEYCSPEEARAILDEFGLKRKWS